MKKIVLFLVILFVFTSTADAQLFGRKKKTYSSRSSYGETSYGYNYKGRQYVRGVDLPDNPNCQCPMCRDLRQAYNAAHFTPKVTTTYVPKVTTVKVQPKVTNSVPVIATLPPPKEKIEVVPTPEPRVETFSENDASTKLIGTPYPDIPYLLSVFKDDVTDDFVLLDPGCGDARLLIEAVKLYNIRAVGIEINPETAKIAKEKVKEAGLENRITIHNGDSRDYSFEGYDGVVMYLFDDLIKDLSQDFKTVKKGAKVVSFYHDIPLEGTVLFDNIYVWINR